MPAKGHESLMLLSGHHAAITAFARSIKPIPVANSRLVTALLVPNNSSPGRVSLEQSADAIEAIRRMTSLPPKDEEFGDITLPSWCMDKIRDEVSLLGSDAIDGKFP